MEKAEVSLPSDREVKVVRPFKAPRALVYRAYTEAALLRRWCVAEPGWSMPVCEMDARVGGSYRWRWRNEADGSEFGFSGVFKELEPGAKIVHTQFYDAGDTGIGMGDGDATVTVTMSESGDVTTVTTLIDFGNKQSCDDSMATGMTDGMEQSYQLLDEVLAGLPSSGDGARS
ncbi:MAG: SRPBCC family protein [Deltaproteobacteria bacterium]|nr:SRPBCC family protein [Deltaproteobacteria bacterium]